ncbi:hypothetical protein AB0M36_06855 [Actinoplanes sp. NPDC051346]|uniref:hypothetical protein n=1 Tax=Actinoplanes sp. NPDC051346 TaxID=3155048 RepID=UPI0034315B42
MARSRLVTRLEPRGPVPLDEVLAARIGDSLWLLARQWQLGELLGEDAGTPVSATLSTITHPLTHVAAGAPDASWPRDTRLDRLPPGVPLEVLVEAAPAARPTPLWRRADAGRALRELVSEAGLTTVADGLAAAYPLDAPPTDDTEATELWPLLAGLPDGDAIADEVAGLDPRDPLPDVFGGAGRPDEVRDVLKTWLAWRDTAAPRTADVPAWDAAALTHRFGLAAASSEGTTVFAADYPGGDVDWYHCAPVRSTGPLSGAEPPTRSEITVTPTLLRFPGMPTERWWEVDDQVVDLGAADAGAADLARLLVLDFAISYGADAYLVPLRLPAASWTTVEELTVVDSFGDRDVIGPAASADWAMFTPDPAAPGLLLVPGAVGRIDGDPMEEISLSRDEVANLAWLVEERWEGGTGHPVERRPPARPPVEAPADPTVDLVWRLVDDPPPSWVPLRPDQDPALGPVLVRLALTGRTTRSLLAGDVADPLPDRAVPHAGRSLTRRYHLAYDEAGRPLLWAGRAVRAATASGAAGTAWDRAELPPRS